MAGPEAERQHYNITLAALVATRLEEVVAVSPMMTGSAAELGNAYVRLGNRDAAIRAYRRPLEQKQMPLDPKLAQQFRDQVARLESAPDPKQVPLMRNPWME